MKKFVPRAKPGSGPGSQERSTSTRTGPRARAAQKSAAGVPFRRPSAEPAGRPQAGRPEPAGRTAVVRLDPDVAASFPDSRAVNAALRLVLQLAQTLRRPRPFERDGARPSFRKPFDKGAGGAPNRDRGPAPARPRFGGDE
jgi:hypothetical protein